MAKNKRNVEDEKTAKMESFKKPIFCKGKKIMNNATGRRPEERNFLSFF